MSTGTGVGTGDDNLNGALSMHEMKKRKEDGIDVENYDYRGFRNL